jgi:pyruvate dehydrogenase phosphatase
VFDGHSGWQASRYLAETLTSRIAEETTGLIQQHLESSRRDPSQLDHSIHSTIKSIFTSIDEEMITLPLTIMSDYETVGPSPRSAFQRLVDLQALLRAVSGSCALVACLDAGRNRLHIAVTGDSRAVMGAWHVSPDGKGGSWKTQVLTEDQTGFNPAELARYQVILIIHLRTLSNTSSDFARNIPPRKMRRLSSTAGPLVVLA